jgi:hypothetical protein
MFLLSLEVICKTGCRGQRTCRAQRTEGNEPAVDGRGVEVDSQARHRGAHA